MNNKPIAWMSPDGKLSKTEGKLFHIPLYAAPKPLSDDEIKKLMEVLPTIINTLTDDDLIQFAKAIEERHGIK